MFTVFLLIFQFRLKILLSLLFTVTTMRLSSLSIISIWLLSFVIWDSNKHLPWFYCPVELPSSSSWNSILITDNIPYCNLICLLILYPFLLYIDDDWWDPCISYVSHSDKEQSIQEKGLDLTDSSRRHCVRSGRQLVTWHLQSGSREWTESGAGW